MGIYIKWWKFSAELDLGYWPSRCCDQVEKKKPQNINLDYWFVYFIPFSINNDIESQPNFKTRCLVYLFVQFRLIVCLLFSLQHSKAFFWTFLHEITLFYGRKIWILAGCTWKINFLKLRKYCFRPSSKWHWVVYSLLYRIFRNSLDKHVSCFMTIKC